MFSLLRQCQGQFATLAPQVVDLRFHLVDVVCCRRQRGAQEPDSARKCADECADNCERTRTAARTRPLTSPRVHYTYPLYIDVWGAESEHRNLNEVALELFSTDKVLVMLRCPPATRGSAPPARKGDPMLFRSLVVAAVVLIASTPVAAQQSSLWSATLTAGEVEYPNGSTRVGYYDLTPIYGSSPIKGGELSDPDFDFRGTTHTFWYFVQPDNGSVTLAFSPPPDEEDLDSLTFTADGHPLTMTAFFSVGTATPDAPLKEATGVQLQFSDPGFRWTVGQRIAVGLTVPTSVPALPLAAAGLLALLLGAGASRRVAGRS